MSVIFSLFLLEKKAYNERQYLKEWRRQRMGNGLSDRKAETQELMQIRQEAYEGITAFMLTFKSSAIVHKFEFLHVI